MALTDTATSVEVTPERAHPARRPWLTRLRPLLAVAAGLLLLVAFPPYGLWWSAPIGVALLALTVHGRRLRAGFGLGALAGLAYFAPLLSWTNLHTGMVPWLLLSGLEALYVGLLGLAGAAATPLVTRWRWTLAPLTGLLWTAQEALRDRTPFGGFPWGRLAFSQDDSPLLRLAAVGGAPLVTFAVGLAGGLLALLYGALAAPPRSWRVVAASAVAFAALPGIAFLVPLHSPGGQRVTVAIVQGSVPRLGLDFNAQRRAVLDNHVRATIELAQRVGRGEVKRPDLVIWPENSSDIDPTVNLDATDAIDDAARAIGAPILVGAVLDGPGDGVQNTALVWQPGGDITGRYVKRHPVPFGEYIPLRSLARRVSDKVDLVATDFTAGHSPGVLAMGTPGRPVTIGDVICFEVAYDGLVRDTVTGGGQLIVVQTNNATFDQAEAGQQLAMVRLRAVEHGRDALMASTVGISGFADASGGVHGATSFDTPAVVVRELHLGDRRTLATRLGSIPELVLVAVALLALAGAAYLKTRGKKESS